MLGFELHGRSGVLDQDSGVLDLMGVPKGESFRTVAGVVPGSKARIQMPSSRACRASRSRLRVPDPGASGMAIRVADIGESARRSMKAKGVRVISRRTASSCNWSPTLRNVFVKDPGGLNIELVGNAPAAK